MRWLGGRAGQKVLDALPKISQGSRSLLVFSPPGGSLHQLDVYGGEAKGLLRKRERRQWRPGWRWNQDAVVGPIHDHDRADRIQAQLGHVLRRVFLAPSRMRFGPVIQVARRLAIV